MAYTVIPDTDIDGDSPIKQQTMERFRDNVEDLFNRSADQSYSVGTGTYTVPSSNVSMLLVVMWGSGGGGGGNARGGGGSGCMIANFISVTPLQSFAYSVSVGGAGGTTNGTDGIDTTFGGYTAKGGGGGTTSGGTKELETFNLKGGAPGQDGETWPAVMFGATGVGSSGGGGAPLGSMELFNISYGAGGAGGAAGVNGSTAATGGGGGGGGSGSTTGGNGGIGGIRIFEYE